MKNPWKRLSKINPKREDGTRQINSKVLSELVMAKLPTAEMSVVLTIISKTWGFNKKTDAISTSQFVIATGFPERTIKRVRQKLLKRRIIFFSESKRVFRGSPLNEYMFNKHYDTWKSQDRKKGVTSDMGDIQGKKRVSPEPPTIETIQKKEIYSRVINYLNNKTGKNYKADTAKTKSLIDARLKEDFKAKDFKKVIDVKTKEWLTDSKNNKFLRPETLFGNKFEGYLNDHGGSDNKQKIPVFTVDEEDRST